MIIHLFKGGQKYTADLGKPIQIAQKLTEGIESSKCFYAPPFEIIPVVAGTFIGDTQQGGSVNFKNIRLNPHGNGTHTECVGHISIEKYSIADCLTRFHFFAEMISIHPLISEVGDKIITQGLLESLFPDLNTEALIIRTLPNGSDKPQRQYSGTNPPYFEAGAIQWMLDHGVQHLLTDLPSVDREEDAGKLAAHKTFWNYPDAPASWRSITELIYAPPEIPDGLYLLNIQIPQMELDAAPSGIVLYALT